MRISFDRLWVVVVLALPAFVALVVPMPAVDLAYQVRAGADILRTGALPIADTWTFTIAGTPWVDQQWLAQVMLAAVHALGGWELLAVLRAALVAGVVGGLFAVARVLGAGVRMAAVLALVAFMLSALAMALRPQLLGMAIFTAVLWLVAQRHTRPQAVLAVVPLLAAWANIHGSFVLGPVILGAAWLDDLAAGRPWRRSLALLLAGALATVASPYGVGVWAYAIGIGTSSAITTMATEWQRTSPLRMPGILFYPSAALVAGAMIRARRRLTPGTVLLALFLFGLGAWTERGVAWWGLSLPVLMAPVLVQRQPLSAGAAPTQARPIDRAHVVGSARRNRASRVNGATAALLLVLIVAALPWWRPADQLTGRVGLLTYAPSELAVKLRALAAPGTRVMAPQTWGSWLEWAVPDAVYFMDSRFELYPVSVWDAVRRVPGPDAQAVLDQWAVQVLVLQDGEMVPAGWREAAVGGGGMICVRIAP